MLNHFQSVALLAFGGVRILLIIIIIHWLNVDNEQWK